jgi:membrane-associated phospholipid phosphatase
VLDAVDIGVNDVWAADAEVFTETLVVNGALVTAAKYIVQRPLPRTYAGDPNLINQPGGYRSFYSGHTSLVFAGLAATAMTMRLRYGEKVWPWVVTGVVGTSVAIERVADGRHFPSDVIVGALMGSATGIAVPWLHARAQSRHQRLRLAFARPGGIGLIYVL